MENTTMEFKVENFAQIDGFIAEFNALFEKGDNKGIVVRFESTVSVDELVKSLKQLWQFEIDSKHTIDILIKNLSYEHRKAALKAALETEDLRNPIFLQNIFCLIKGYNTFEESYFNHEQVFLNDEVEFLDIFDDLENEINTVSYKIAEYYVSMIKTCNMIDGVENNPNSVKLEPLYEYLFSAVDVTILARILSSIKDPAIWETKKIVINSLGYLGLVAEKFVFTNTLLDLFGSTFLKEAVENSIKDQE